MCTYTVVQNIYEHRNALSKVDVVQGTGYLVRKTVLQGWEPPAVLLALRCAARADELLSRVSSDLTPCRRYSEP